VPYSASLIVRLYPVQVVGYSVNLSSDCPETISHSYCNKDGLIPTISAKKPLQSNFLSLQKWEGFVIEVTKTSFVARLVDLTNEGPDEEAEFLLEKVSKDDLKLLTPGAIFYWNIGYSKNSAGQRTRSSSIRFRRLPALRAKNVDEVKRDIITHRK